MDDLRRELRPRDFVKVLVEDSGLGVEGEDIEPDPVEFLILDPVPDLEGQRIVHDDLPSFAADAGQCVGDHWSTAHKRIIPAMTTPDTGAKAFQTLLICVAKILALPRALLGSRIFSRSMVPKIIDGS